MVEKIIGLDIGDVRIGIAVSDALGITAQPHSVINRSSLDADIDAIHAVISETSSTHIVAGLPLNAEGKQGHQAEKAIAFAETLHERLGIEVTFQDERFTTALARRSLIDAGANRKKRKQVVDKIAAQQILQCFLDRRAFLNKEARR